MTNITANELKIKGIASVERALHDSLEVGITIRGREKYVVVDIDRYNYLRECELETALVETRRDVKNKKTYTESVQQHIKRISNEL